VTAWGRKTRMVDPKPVPAKRSYRERFNHLLAEWGQLVLWVYFGIFAIVIVSFAIAIQLGFKSAEGTAEAAGTWGGFLATMGAAYVATKLTQPLRIAATLVITPVLAALLRRVRKHPAPVAPGAAPVDAESTSADSARLEPPEPSKP
jgi:hypothetical protein